MASEEVEEFAMHFAPLIRGLPCSVPSSYGCGYCYEAWELRQRDEEDIALEDQYYTTSYCDHYCTNDEFADPPEPMEDRKHVFCCDIPNIRRARREAREWWNARAAR